MYCLIKITKMDDGDSKNNQQAEKQRKQINVVQRYGINAGTILQSLWVRCRTIFPNATDRKLWKANFVLYCIAGLFFGLYIWFTKRLSKN